MTKIYIKSLFFSIALTLLCCSSNEENMDTEIELLKNQFNYYAFPDICKISPDSLAMVFYSGFGHVSDPLTTSKETALGGKILISYSTDKGRSWGYPEVLIDTEADDRDPSISIDSNNRMYVVFFKRKIFNGKPFIEGTFFVSSDDFGKTWSNVKLIQDGYAVSTPLREFAPNRLISTIYASKTRFEEQFVAVTESNNMGNSWSKPVRIFSESDSSFNEADLAKIGENTLIASMRPTNLKIEMEYSISYNQGKSWQKSLPFGHQGISPYFFTSENLVLYAYANVKGINLRQINPEKIGSIGTGAVNVDTGGNVYPSIAQVDENEYLIVYHNDQALAPYSYLKGRSFRIENGKIVMISNPFPIILPISNR